MSRVSKELGYRYEGALWGIRIAKEHGLDFAEEELRKRGAINLPLTVTQSELDNAVEGIKNNILKTVLCMTVYVLHDEFDMEQEQINSFIDRFNKKCDFMCGVDAWYDWKDLQTLIRNEIGIEVSIPECFEREV